MLGKTDTCAYQEPLNERDRSRLEGAAMMLAKEFTASKISIAAAHGFFSEEVEYPSEEYKKIVLKGVLRAEDFDDRYRDLVLSRPIAQDLVARYNRAFYNFAQRLQGELP